MSTTSKARWWKCESPLSIERHHVVVGVDVEPDAVLAEPVGEPHPERLGVEAALLVEVAGQEVDVPELARVADDGAPGRARVRDQSRFGLAVGQQLDRVAVGVGGLDPTFRRHHSPWRRTPRGARAPGRASSPVRARRRRGRVLPAQPAISSSAQGSSSQASSTASSRRLADVEPELRAPARRRLVEVGDAQADVVDPVQLDHQRTRPAAA